MAWTPTENENDVKGRIDDLEARVNGILLYIAAREAGVEPKIDDPKFKEFVASHVTRPWDARLLQQGPKASDGHHDAGAIGAILRYVRELKASFLPSG